MSRSQRTRRRNDLVQHVHRGASAGDVFERASARLRHLVDFDAAAWIATDPATGFPTSPVRIEHLEGVSRELCMTHWRHELLGGDVNLFRDLARRPAPVASLRAVVDEPERSARFRRFLAPLGLGDELRAVLRVGTAPWGSLTLWRREDQPPFTARDAALVNDVAAPIGEALRRHARPVGTPDPPPDHDRPGLLLFDAAGELLSANDEARQWLDELPPEPGVSTAYGYLPVWMLITVFRAGAVPDGVGDGTARTRVRTRRGRWLMCHASSLHTADGTEPTTAVVIEPAQPAAIAPIVGDAYDLTEREQQIVRCIARGASTADIAGELFLSPHIVRDHVKAIFTKVGVSSRGELTAKLFAEFYEPLHAAGR